MTREEAIEDIEKNIIPIVGGNSLRMAVDALRQPERKTGRWIEENDGLGGVFWMCSECYAPYTMIDGLLTYHKYKFCPNCGARMEGEQDGKNT